MGKDSRRRRARHAGAIGVVALIVGITLGTTAAAHQPRRARPSLQILTLSARADLISGGEAVVRIVVPHGQTSRLRVTLGRRNVTRAFAWRADGYFEGLVKGLRLGRNVLVARERRGSGARLTITNHSNGGPLFSGPQLWPWKCEPRALDRKCDQRPKFKYEYMSTNASKSGFQPYNPKRPPTDVAMTTTDQGVRVPFIVRIETGYMDRDQYQIGTLFQPRKRWSWAAPQRQWNHKLLILHGASCGMEYQTGTAPDVTGSSNATGSPALGVYALGRGFMTMSTALDNSGHDCNVAIQAESLLMAKEHIVNDYGTLRYTIGTGCSGGSLAEQWIANAYPGIYQGILPTCSFPDSMSAATQVVDYALLERYFLTPKLWGTGVAWSPSQFGAVEGNALPVDAFVSVGCLQPAPPYNSTKCPTGYSYAAVPYWNCAGTTAKDRYNPQTNPTGLRCSIFTLDKNLLGLRRPGVWSAVEQKIGHGFPGMPLDNVGVQYGLAALKAGMITPAQFVDLNAKVGGLTVDIYPTSKRLTADQPALANAYRSGLINEASNLNQTAIIDCRGPDPGAAHDAFRAFAVRARLQRDHGTHANQLIWEGPEPIFADKQCELNGFMAMDRWLTAVEKDKRSIPVARKLIVDKPKDLSDRCYNGSGVLLSHGLCPPGVVPVYGTPRTVAGDPITTDANKCQLKPLRRSDYSVTFTSAQWAELKRTFPTSVCDFSKPGVSQQPTIPWMTYQSDAAGRHVIWGGRPLGPAPRSVALRG